MLPHQIHIHCISDDDFAAFQCFRCPDRHLFISARSNSYYIYFLQCCFLSIIQVERTWDLVRDSGQRKLTYSSQNHCTSTLRSGRRKTIVSQTMCAPAERLSQSEIVLPLRKTCYYSPLAEVGVFSTEIKQHFLCPYICECYFITIWSSFTYTEQVN